MSNRHFFESLEDMTVMRSREVDRCAADMARRHAVRARYVSSILRLEEIFSGSGSSSSSGGGTTGAAAFSPARALNGCAFKQSVMQLLDAQRLDLALHDADAAVAQRALLEATRRREAIGHVLERERESLARDRARRERLVQDETAVQVWSRANP